MTSTAHKSMEPAFFSFEPHFKKHKGKKNVEIEMRLGRTCNGKFDTNVGKDAFTKARVALDSYKQWDKIEVNEYDSYYGPNNLRTTRYEDDSQESIFKKRVVNVDYNSPDLPFDVRMGISTETRCEPGDDMEYEFSNHKMRTSYIRKGVRIDCTIVSGDQDDKDAEDAEQYQLEVEIIDIKSIKNKRTLYNYIYKIKDLCDCL